MYLVFLSNIYLFFINIPKKSSIFNLDTNGSELTCPSIWDGWSCHGATIAGKVSKVKCAPHIIEDTCNAILGKKKILNLKPEF